MKREDIFEYAKQQYGTEPEYLWNSYPSYAVLRNNSNGKWYAVIMDIPKNKLGLSGDEITDIINVKCSSLMIGSLIENDGFFPAYHMNKNNWVSIILDDMVSDEEIKGMMAASYELVSPKRRKKK